MAISNLGAWLTGDGASFRVWAPQAQTLWLVLEGPARQRQPLEEDGDGYFLGHVPALRAGQLYRYAINDGPSFPDPATRCQPQGVHGPSQIVDLDRYPWSDATWKGIEPQRLVIYEIHIGTFTAEGTFQAAAAKLPLLRDLGVTAIEIMPLADFPGRWNWGYDGVCLYAPARCYGPPEDLQRLVDEAHRLGLAVLLDVVYNHLGPDGNYTGVYSPYYVTTRHHTPWGKAFNFDGPHSRPVRDFFIENALHWLGAYHFDGLRLDATHIIEDDSPEHILAELARRVHDKLPQPRRLLIAEDSRNLNAMLRPASQGGWGLDGIWADDLHHIVRRHLTGDHEAYFRDYQGTMSELARCLNQGWLYCGEPSQHWGKPRGTDPAGLDPSQFVISIQNHDQTGNRAGGERLAHDVDLATFRAASALLLLAPQTPLLFMGQEWAASTPFLFFTDHNLDLGKLVTAGRRKEFERFRSFSGEVPDPQDVETFERSRLIWEERAGAPHAATLALYRDLLRWRGKVRGARWRAVAHDEETLVLRYNGDGAECWLLVVRWRGPGVFDLQKTDAARALATSQTPWTMILSTEDPTYAPDSAPIHATIGHDALRLAFARAGAALLRGL